MNSDSERSSFFEGSLDRWEVDYDPPGESFKTNMQRIRGNDPFVQRFEVDNEFECIETMTDEDWEQFGRDISNNTYLRIVCLKFVLDDHRMSCLFRGLTRSSSIEDMILQFNNLTAAGVRCMIPFLQNAKNLQTLDLCWNNLQSEGFNVLFRSLNDSPIQTLKCCRCHIESIEIDIESAPKNLTTLNLYTNGISADGCRELAKLMQGGDATLTELNLGNNAIDDEGVAILVDALNSNTLLTTLSLFDNYNISKQGEMMLLKLVNDASSIEATLKSNHTLRNIHLDLPTEDDPMHEHILMATRINLTSNSNLEVAGRAKVIKTQLHSVRRAELMELQGVNQSVYSEINPLHLPEVLASVGQHHGQSEFYVALKSSIAGVISTVSRKECLKQQVAHDKAKIAEYKAKVEAAEAELASLEAAEGRVFHIGSESRSNKRRRKWWGGAVGKSLTCCITRRPC